MKEEKKPVQETERPTLTLVSDMDAYISERMKNQPKTLDEALFVKEKKYAPGEHRLSLPPELKGYTKKITFRWLNKKKRAIDDAIDVKGWMLVNRALFPSLPKHLFTTSGAIERGDCVLAFIPNKKAEAIRRAPREKSQRMKEASPMISKPEPLRKGQSGFYRPEDTSPEKEEKEGATGLQEGRDF